MDVVMRTGVSSSAGAHVHTLKCSKGDSSIFPLWRCHSLSCDPVRSDSPSSRRSTRARAASRCPADACLGTPLKEFSPGEAAEVVMPPWGSSSFFSTRLSGRAGLTSRTRRKGARECRTRAKDANDREGEEDEREAREDSDQAGEGRDSGSQGSAETSRASGEIPDVESLDWRRFRARLVVSEREDVRVRPGDGGIGLPETMGETSGDVSGVELGTLWAHAIHAPEKGCLLVASELLVDYPFFDRSVILLLGEGSGPSNGPHGIALNKSFPSTVGKFDAFLPGLGATFGRNQMQLGGPMGRRTVQMIHGHAGLEGHWEVMPGVFVGGQSGLASATEAVLAGKAKAEDFQIVLGYAGWEHQQLLDEVANGWWYVAACNAEVVLEARKKGLEKGGHVFWRDVLQLMGGEYPQVGKRCLEEE